MSDISVAVFQAEELRNKAINHLGAMEGLRAKLKASNKGLSDAEAACADLLGRLDKGAAEAAALKAALKASEANKEMLKAELEKSAADNKELLARLAAVNARLKAKLKELEDSAGKIKDLNLEKAKFMDLLKAAERAKEDLEGLAAARGAATNNRHDLLNDEMADLHDRADALAAELKARDADLKRARGTTAKVNILPSYVYCLQHVVLDLLGWRPMAWPLKLWLLCSTGCCGGSRCQEGRGLCSRGPAGPCRSPRCCRPRCRSFPGQCLQQRRRAQARARGPGR